MTADVETDAPGLFDEPDRVPGTGDPDERTPGERMRDRHLAAIARGVHPLSLALGVAIALHPDARRDGDREPDGSPRCGGCVYRRHVNGGARSWPKCAVNAVERETHRNGRTFRWHDYPRASRGPGTDVAAWWPGCRDHHPRPTDQNGPTP